MKMILLISFIALPILAEAGVEVMPLEAGAWHQLEFNGIKPNRVSFQPDSLKVEVDQSASPLVHKLSNIQNVVGFEVELKVNGAMSEAPASEFEEDSFFRLGLVATGEKKLGKLQALFAPGWVKQLFDLAPEGVGLDKIYFYNLATSPSQINRERQNPKSNYIFERVIAVKESSSQKIRYQLKNPMKTAALWISIDGDNTRSKFTTFINSIKLETK